ncbi:copper amine oxidase N-terminal domain-containing protein [Paenibacillus sp. N1-5-1-14]|uniref:copper amine oxidase N-terminal domain-containing protein n=1 Tax=Paenibacillus radicibacter TaxID=2972488 RepID=UPI002159B199|nr:copper amine oxidase N-terminal domain-containing protein [Paenibacillus radicibacter]MCR8644309.1 copper amine oxidase N-terminal domain-containing protein [Paenibacillus radicibacter]
MRRILLSRVGLMLFSLTMISMVTYVQTTDAKVDINSISYPDPTYQVRPKTDSNGLTDNKIYSFQKGEKETAPDEVLLMINGEFTDTKVIITSNRSLVPIRTVAEAYGASVQWDESTQTIRIKDENNEIVMQIGITVASVNGKTITMDAEPIQDNGRTYVPLRFISICLNKAVGYLPAGKQYLHAIADKDVAKGLAPNPIVWIDDPAKMNKSNSTEEILVWLKSQMKQGLNCLKINLDTAHRGSLVGKSLDDPTFVQIDKAIDDAYYVGNIGRYEMFEGPYLTLVDPNANIIYFYTTPYLGGVIWKADMNDPDTFVPMYFAD